MKSKLLIFFLLFTGLVYLFSSLELNGKERKQNYTKETHTCVSCDTKTADIFHAGKIPVLPATFINNSFRLQFNNVFALASYSADYSPPDKIYLHQHSLLI